MENNRLDDLLHKFSKIFTTKRTRYTLYMAAVLWVAFATQIVVNRMFREEAQITEAFIKSDTQEMSSSLEILSEYKDGLLSETDKSDVIKEIADSIGLNIDKDITVWEDETRSEYYFYKQAKEASTEIKLVSTGKDKEDKLKNYIIVRLNILQGMESIDGYKNILEDTLTQLGVKSRQVNLEYEGSKEGDLTSEQKHDIAVMLVDELQGEIAFEYDEGDLYTVYAYTGMLNEYVTSMGNKINVQIAITFNELTNKTKISLATPINNESW